MLFFLIGLFSVTTFVTASTRVEIKQENKPEITKLVSEPIIIVGNQELRDMANFMQWTGNGTAEDPFIISGYIINKTFGDGIVIQSTTDYITIKNNSVMTQGEGRGIAIISATNIIITENFIQDSTFGIEIISSKVTVDNNTIISNKNGGIRVRLSDHSLITNNYLQSNRHSSIDVISSYSINITKNIVVDTIYMFTESGDYGSGVYLKDSSNIIVNFNCLSNSINSNIMVNGNSNTNLIESNLINKNGIDIAFQSGNNTIRNNTILNARLGIYSGDHNVGFQLVENNSIFFSTLYGIGIGHQNNIIRYNDIYGSPNGLVAEDGYFNDFYGNSLEKITENEIKVKNLNRPSNDNKFYLNSFHDLEIQVSIENEDTYLDNSTYGNYWADYGGSDLNNTGIGEESHEITNVEGYSNFVTDFYPLMNSYRQVNLTKFEIAVDIFEKIESLKLGFSTDTTILTINTNLTNHVSSESQSNLFSTKDSTPFLILSLLGILGIFGLGYTWYKKRDSSNEIQSRIQTSPKPTSTSQSIPILKNVFCFNCGTKATLDDNYCESCGTRLF